MGVGVGVHEARVLAGGTIEWVVVCRRLECWMEKMLHRSWCFQEISHKVGTTSLEQWCLYDAASLGIIIV